RFPDRALEHQSSAETANRDLCPWNDVEYPRAFPTGDRCSRRPRRAERHGQLSRPELRPTSDFRLTRSGLASSKMNLDIPWAALAPIIVVAVVFVVYCLVDLARHDVRYLPKW